MQFRLGSIVSILIVAAVLCSDVAVSNELTLTQVTFPERREVEFNFIRTDRAPTAHLRAEVKHREGQAEVVKKNGAAKHEALRCVELILVPSGNGSSLPESIKVGYVVDGKLGQIMRYLRR